MYKLLYTTKNAYLRINNILKNNISSWQLNDTIKTTLKCFGFSLFFIRIENYTFISEKFLKISEILVSEAFEDKGTLFDIAGDSDDVTFT